MREVRWRRRLGGLHWRLSLSYVLVTLIAALTIEVALTLMPLIQQFQESSASLDQILAKQGLQITPYLQQALPDEAALRYLVAVPLFDTISSDGKIALVAIVDRNGHVLTSTACGRSQLLSVGTKACAATTMSMTDTLLTNPQVQAAIHTVLMNTRQSIGTLSAGDTFAVVPILGNEKQAAGASVVIFNGPISTQGHQSIGFADFVAAFWDRWQPAGFYFILLASIIGTCTGIIISRNLTHRLRRITQAAAAWSQGEFQAEVQDHSRDEVGQLAQHLNSMAEQLQTLFATRQALAVVEERNRLARDLHDSVKQHVFTNALLVRAARKMFPRDPQAAEKHLVEAEELAGQAQQELIALIHALRPAALADKGLVSVLQGYVADWSHRTGMAMNIRVQGERTTPLDIEEALLRLTQEALANVARHSDAQEVELQLVWTEEQVSLSIRDNGKGFDIMGASGKGMGLASMRERVEALHGTLIISSSASGTVVDASFPLSLSSLIETAKVEHE